MIPLLTREAVRAIDREAVETLGVPSIVLMENAGRGATEAILARFRDRLGHVVIVGGTGQNGGDGWVVARHLHIAGVKPECVLIGEEHRVRDDARTNLDAIRKLGVLVRGGDALEGSLRHATLVVDALFGTGLDRPVEGDQAAAITRIDGAGAPCIALDLPSGVDANTGQILGVAPRAVLTATFAAHKRGLHQFPGAAHAGEIVLVPIGVPLPPIAETAILEPADVARLIPRRAADAHKGTAGHVMIVAGSPGKTGAALLTSQGAMRAGAGLVTIAARGDARQALDMKVVESMTHGLPDGADEAVESALGLAKRSRAAGVGPGLGLDDEGRKLAVALAVRLPIPAVLDADGLTAVSGDMERLRHAEAPRVLTPHPAEAARLLGASIPQVQADRYAAAARLAERSGAVVVLKGACTVIASPDGALRVCRQGTVALGAGGTGDVLTGVIAALLAVLPPFDAASAGVVLHAMAGEIAAKSDRGLLAHEVADALPLALERARTEATRSGG